MLTEENQKRYKTLRAFGYQLMTRLHHINPSVEGNIMITHGTEWLHTYREGDEDFEFLVIGYDVNKLIEEGWDNYLLIREGCDDMDDDYLVDDGA